MWLLNQILSYTSTRSQEVTMKNKKQESVELPPEATNRLNGKAEIDTQRVIAVRMPTFKQIRLGVVGTTPLRMHALPAKGIFDDDGLAKDDRRPWAEFEKAINYEPSVGFFLKPNAFKEELVASSQFVRGLNGRVVARCINILDRHVVVHGSMPRMEVVDHRIGKDRIPTKRYTPQFDKWWCVLTIDYAVETIKLNSLQALLAWAGRGGVGDCRPDSKKNRTGNSGMFHLPTDKNEMLAAIYGQTFAPPTPETTPEQAAAFMAELHDKVAKEAKSVESQQSAPKGKEKKSHG